MSELNTKSLIILHQLSIEMMEYRKVVCRVVNVGDPTTTDTLVTSVSGMVIGYHMLQFLTGPRDEASWKELCKHIDAARGPISQILGSFAASVSARAGQGTGRPHFLSTKLLATQGFLDTDTILWYALLMICLSLPSPVT